MFSPSQFKTTFPFCVLLDSDAQITGVGRALQQHSSALVGRVFWEVFDLLRTELRVTDPGTIDTGLGKLVNRPIGIKTSFFQFPLIGALYEIESGFAFLGTPRVNTAEQLEESGLTISDFAPHDPAVGYLVLMQEFQLARIEAERLSAQNARRRAELEQVLDRAHDLIFSLTYDGTIRLTNPSARTALELSRDNMNLRSLFTPDNKIDLKAVAQREHEDEVTLNLVTPSGRSVELQGRFLGLEGERTGDLIAFFRDVTEENRVSRELAQTNKQLVRSQRMDSVGRLAGAVAHDFNNLLTVIMGSAELSLLAVDPSDQLGQDLELILSTARKGQEISRQLLMVSSRAPDASGRCDVIAAIRSLTPILRLMSGRGTLNLALEIESCWIDISPSRMEQVLMNLVINAAEAISEGGRITLVVRPENQGQTCLLQASDDGCGIEPSHLERIFEPYFTTKHATNGSGIGLSTVFGIVRDVDGTIEVESELGEGTTFLLRLPVSSEQSSPTPAKVPDSFQQMQGQVVVVEDNAGVNQVVSRYLRDMGLDVVSHHGFKSAQEGWIALNSKADILITDVSLGDGCGLELARASMEAEKCHTVLILTGHADMDRLSSMIDTYQWGLLLKPFGAKELREKVRERFERVRGPLADHSGS